MTESFSDGQSYARRLARIEKLRLAVLAVADIGSLLAAFLSAAAVAAIVSEAFLERPYRDFAGQDTFFQLLVMCGLGVLLMLGFHLKGHYVRRLSFWVEAKHVVGGCALMLLANGFVMFALKESFSRLWVGFAWLLLMAAIPVGRHLAKVGLDLFDLWRMPVVVVGSGTEAEAACYAMRSEKALGYVISEVIGLSELPPGAPGWSWAALYEARGAQFVVFALSREEMVEQGELLADLVRERLPFAVVPPLQGLPVLGFDQLYFVRHDVAMLVGRNNLANSPARFVKGAFDRVAAVLLLLALAPVFALFAAIIKFGGGPVFYDHVRIGRKGRSFVCHKFRTMVPDAERRLAELLENDAGARAEWACYYKLKNDPRVTPFGRFLRRTSLDELPQLINVLLGEMSLVGPRPITSQELALYGRDASFYLEAKPGITGLWQISGRNDISYEQRVSLDIWYIKNWSFWHDIAILAMTLPVVLRRVGAF